MKSFLGPEPQFTVVILLVFGPLLFGLMLLLLGLAKDLPATLIGMATRPADYPTPLSYLLIWLSLFDFGPEEQDEDPGAHRLFNSTYTWLFWLSLGVFVGLGAAKNEIASNAGIARNVAGYFALAAGATYLGLRWRLDRRQQAEDRLPVS